MSSLGFTQTNFTINADSPNLQGEYQQELDKWMLQAYEGDRDAQFKVGVLFANDQFNSADDEQAVYWYKQAARQGHILAQFNLGHHYLTGEGAVRDESVAMAWWLKAAEQDHALAAFNVGRAYYLGIGLDEDHTLARYWFERAAQNKEPKSIEILEKLGWAQPGQYQSEQTADKANQALAKANQTLVAAASSSARREQIESKTQPIEPFQTQPILASPAPQAIEPATAVLSQKRVKHPLAIYTDPTKRSVLVTILDNRDGVDVQNEGDEWTVVTLADGLPVWVHQNFIETSGNNGVITGSSVNARSVPLIASGTVVGQLDKGEEVRVIDKQNEWYRVQSPPRFKGWAKTAEYNSEPTVELNSEPAIELSSTKPQVKSVSTLGETSDGEQTNSNATGETEAPIESREYANTNEWLFNQPTDNYTLQLASFDDPSESNEFESRQKLSADPNLRRFVSNNNGIEWIYYLYGTYPSLLQAENERDRLKQQRAWIRSFGRLQQNRCLAWKKQVPAPSELNTYCVN